MVNPVDGADRMWKVGTNRCDEEEAELVVKTSSLAAAPSIYGQAQGPIAARVARVFVLARIRLYRDGIARALAEDERFSVLGTGSDGEPGLEDVVRLRPDAVLVDTSVPACS